MGVDLANRIYDFDLPKYMNFQTRNYLPLYMHTNHELLEI